MTENENKNKNTAARGDCGCDNPDPAAGEEKRDGEESEELDLRYRDGKEVAKGGLLGFFIGLAIIVPGVNVIAALLLFIVAFMGFGKSNGQKSTLAMVGLIMTIIAIAGSWVYNAYAASFVGEMLGLAPKAAETAGEVATAATGA